MTNIERLAIDKIRNLSPEAQQQILVFAEFLEFKARQLEAEGMLEAVAETNDAETLDRIEHPFWQQAIQLDGYEGWHSPLIDKLPDGTPIQIRVEFDDPDDPIVQANFTAIRQRWLEIWPRILHRTIAMKTAYGYGDTPIRSESEWFGLKLPTEPIEDNAEWSVMLQAEEAGWLLDFRGWIDADGQGVF
jgi:hypothetical protein